MQSKTCSAYGFGTINFSDLDLELKQNGGTVLVNIVLVETGTGGQRLKYGLFYKDIEERVFDVVARSTCQLKTYFTSDTVLKAVRDLVGREVIPVPTLVDKNVIRFGELR